MSSPRRRSRRGWRCTSSSSSATSSASRPSSEFGCDPILDRFGAKLFQAADLGPCERLVGEVGERRAAPQRQSSAKLVHGERRVSRGQGRPAVCQLVLEALQIELAVLEAQLIAGRPRHQQTAGLARGPIRLERLPQPRHRHLQRLRGVLESSLPPELLDQAVPGDHLVGVQQQQRQQRPLLGPPERERPIAVEYLQRPQDPEVHQSSPHGDRNRPVTRP